jgi:hypothetical protein
MTAIQIGQIAAGVFLGNILTLSVFYSFRSFFHYREDQKLSWAQAGGFMLPIVFFLAVLSSALT